MGSGYRYGFNGKEKDDEISGSGNSYDYGFRIYNPRIGRFLSVDPLSPSFPMLTPYQFASNMPIAAIDLDGLEAFIHTFITDDDGATLTLISHIELDKPGPLGNGHLYIYQNRDNNSSEQFYYEEVYKGNRLNETYVGERNPDDYGQAPQDFVDYAAYRHDKAYDAALASGPDDANFNLDVLDADNELVQMAREAQQIYSRGGIDPITGETMNYGTKVTAYAVEEYFDDIVEDKQTVVDFITQGLNEDSKATVQGVLGDYNKANETDYTTTKTRSDFVSTDEK